MKRIKFSWTYAILIIGVVVLAYLVMDFNNRMAALRNLTAEKEVVAAELGSLEKTQAALVTQMAFATSEAAVEKWAYEEGHMVQPGDNPVIPVPAAGSTPVPTPMPASNTTTVSNWQMWLWLFVDPKSGQRASSP